MDRIMNRKYKSLMIIAGLSVMLGITACEKSLEVEPDPSFGLAPDVAIQNAEDMQQLLNSCYDACANMMNGQFQVLSDLMGDDVVRPTNNDGNLTAIYNHTSSEFNGTIGGAYAQPYFTIYRCNIMDLYWDQLDLSASEKDRMQGEAAFLRALCHYETVKLWAQPAGYTGDNSHNGIIERKRALNEVVPRTPVASNYNFIINDLNTAIAKLPVSNGVYANQAAAKALLAKVYFTMGRYDDALPLLNDVIGLGFTLSDSLNRFKRAEVESEIIFGFVTAGTPYDINVRGATFKDMYRNDLLPDGNLPILGLSADLRNLLKGDTSDQRGKLVKVINEGQPNEFYASTKFNINDFASPYLTLTDMLLTRAEIHAIKGNTAQAISDILPIVKRAYVPSANKELAINALSGPALVEEIRLQRRLEMHLEGDRLTQVKRIGAFHNNTQTIRNAPWNCNGMVLQFPASAGTVKGFQFNPTGGCN